MSGLLVTVGDRTYEVTGDIHLTEVAATPEPVDPEPPVDPKPEPVPDQVPPVEPAPEPRPDPRPEPQPDPEPKLRVRWGMSAPRSQWDAALASLGDAAPGLKARRLFADDPTSLDGILKLAESEQDAGRHPVVSLKFPGVRWAAIANGGHDAALDAVFARLAAVRRRLFVALHHEPINDPDGTAAEYARMQVRWMLRAHAAGVEHDLGPIINGHPFTARPGGAFTDDEIAAWLPDEVLGLSDVVAADTYHGGTVADPGENASVKIGRMSAWADRRGVKRLGLGEFQGLTPAAILAACAAVEADPRFDFACIFNSDVNNREGVSWRLTGDRLAAFQTAITT